jgi:hypothetical protein
MDEKSKREEYGAGCVPEATQCSEGGICGVHERNRWVKDDPKCVTLPQDAVFG